MIRVLILAALFLSCLLRAKEEVNNGEDVTRPITRLDVRVKEQTGVGSQNGRASVLTLRSDLTFPLKNKWQLALRGDAPFEAFRCPRHPCEACYNARHMGDSLLQLFLITPTYGKWTYAIGVKEIFPTGGKNLEIGDGKYQTLPSLAFRYDLSSWSEGAYVGAIIRQAWSTGGYASAPPIRQTFIQPFFNLNLPCGWFLNSSPEMFYDWKSRHWFVPFDLMIGKLFSKKLVVSLEYESAIVYDYPEYRQQVEFRVGVFF